MDVDAFPTIKLRDAENHLIIHHERVIHALHTVFLACKFTCKFTQRDQKRNKVAIGEINCSQFRYVLWV